MGNTSVVTCGASGAWEPYNPNCTGKCLREEGGRDGGKGKCVNLMQSFVIVTVVDPPSHP